MTSKHVLLVTKNMQGGGIQRIRAVIANQLAKRNITADIAIAEEKNESVWKLPNTTQIIPLAKESRIAARKTTLAAWSDITAALLPSVILHPRTENSFRIIRSLTRLIQEKNYNAVLSTTFGNNIPVAMAFSLLNPKHPRPRLVMSEHGTLTDTINQKPSFISRHHWRTFPPLLRRAYEQADVVVSVSADAADDIAQRTGFPRERINVIHNPVVDDDLLASANQPCEHQPVVLAVGRLHRQKGFDVLIRACAQLKLPLTILGDGTERKRLTALAQSLNVNLSLPGFDPNPFRYMRRAKVFALSSRWEGLPATIIQALACGCPVVSADCPTGPREILQDGQFGILTPVDDVANLAEAIKQTLKNPLPSELLQARAKDFTPQRIMPKYLKALGFNCADEEAEV